jgi:hypothetical protein
MVLFLKASLSQSFSQENFHIFLGEHLHRLACTCRICDWGNIKDLFYRTRWCGYGKGCGVHRHSESFRYAYYYKLFSGWCVANVIVEKFFPKSGAKSDVFCSGCKCCFSFSYSSPVLGRWNIEEWRDKARKAVSAFHDSLKSFASDPNKLILPVAFSIFSWFFSILVYYLVFVAIGYTVDWFVLIIVYSLVIALKSIPVGVPAEMGVTEIAMTTLFGAFSVPLHISAAATVLIRIVTVWFRLVIGFGAIQWVGVKTIMESETPVGQKKEM